MNNDKTIIKLHDELYQLIKQYNSSDITTEIFHNGINKIQEELYEYLYK